MNVWNLISYYLFLYPLVMSVVWIVGGIYFYFRRERKTINPPVLDEYPMVSILVPAHNEELVIEETIRELLKIDYPNFEIIVVDDGSKDNTPQILRKLVKETPVRVVFMKKNMGKPCALNAALLCARGEIVLTSDADAFVDPQALKWIVWHFVKFPRVGAVTGNPRVRNRTTLLAKIQTAEYSTIIGLIKRTQRILGKVMTVSGVIAAFRKRALLDVGLWDKDMITDDINITWKMEKKFWDIRYEPNALSWMLVPETLKGLWKQRVRWAQGGVEVLRRHWDIWLSWKCRRLWPVYFDQVLSIIWAYAFIISAALWIVTAILPGEAVGSNPIPEWWGFLISFVCLIQFLVAMLLDTKYDPTITRYYLWVVWYPYFYWILNALAVVRALLKGLFLQKKGTCAVWESPDRGILPEMREGIYGTN